MHPAVFMILAKMGEKFAEELGQEAVKAVAREIWGKEIENDSEVESVLSDFKDFLDESGLKL